MMNCIRAQRELIPYLHGELTADHKTALLNHVADCESCRRQLAFEQLLQESLNSLPVPPPRFGFHDRVLSNLPAAPAANGRTWLAGALAATVAVCLTLGILNFTTPRAGDLAHIKLAVDEVKLVRLKFDAPRDFDQVTLSLQLPEHLELQGFPGQRKIAWKTTLVKGANVLRLPVIARKPMDGTLVANIVGKNKTKAFKVVLKADQKQSMMTGEPWIQG